MHKLFNSEQVRARHYSLPLGDFAPYPWCIEGIGNYGLITSGWQMVATPTCPMYFIMQILVSSKFILSLSLHQPPRRNNRCPSVDAVQIPPLRTSLVPQSHYGVPQDLLCLSPSRSCSQDVGWYPAWVGNPSVRAWGGSGRGLTMWAPRQGWVGAGWTCCRWRLMASCWQWPTGISESGPCDWQNLQMTNWQIAPWCLCPYLNWLYRVIK